MRGDRKDFIVGFKQARVGILLENIHSIDFIERPTRSTKPCQHSCSIADMMIWMAKDYRIVTANKHTVQQLQPYFLGV